MLNDAENFEIWMVMRVLDERQKTESQNILDQRFSKTLDQLNLGFKNTDLG